MFDFKSFEDDQEVTPPDTLPKPKTTPMGAPEQSFGGAFANLQPSYTDAGRINLARKEQEKENYSFFKDLATAGKVFGDYIKEAYAPGTKGALATGGYAATEQVLDLADPKRASIANWKEFFWGLNPYPNVSWHMLDMEQKYSASDLEVFAKKKLREENPEASKEELDEMLADAPGGATIGFLNNLSEGFEEEAQRAYEKQEEVLQEIREKYPEYLQREGKQEILGFETPFDKVSVSSIVLSTSDMAPSLTAAVLLGVLGQKKAAIRSAIGGPAAREAAKRAAKKSQRLADAVLATDSLREIAPIYLEEREAGVSHADAFRKTLITGVGIAAIDRLGYSNIIKGSPVSKGVRKVLGDRGAVGVVAVLSEAMVRGGSEGFLEVAQELYQFAVVNDFEGTYEQFMEEVNALEVFLGGFGIGTPNAIYAASVQDMTRREAEMDVDKIRQEVMLNLMGEDPAFEIGDQELRQRIATVSVQGSAGEIDGAVAERVLEFVEQREQLLDEAAQDPTLDEDQKQAVAEELFFLRDNKEDNLGAIYDAYYAPRESEAGADAATQDDSEELAEAGAELEGILDREEAKKKEKVLVDADGTPLAVEQSGEDFEAQAVAESEAQLVQDQEKAAAEEEAEVERGETYNVGPTEVRSVKFNSPVKGAKGTTPSENPTIVATFQEDDGKRLVRRAFVVREINGVRVPFYLSSGLAGKEAMGVAAGKWYPIFGVKGMPGEVQWINKGRSEDIKNYYNSPELKRVAEDLDRKLGNIYETSTYTQNPETGRWWRAGEKSKGLPEGYVEVPETAENEKLVEEWLNQDLSPVTGPKEKGFAENAQQLLQRLQKASEQREKKQKQQQEEQGEGSFSKKQLDDVYNALVDIYKEPLTGEAPLDQLQKKIPLAEKRKEELAEIIRKNKWYQKAQKQAKQANLQAEETARKSPLSKKDEANLKRVKELGDKFSKRFKVGTKTVATFADLPQHLRDGFRDTVTGKLPTGVQGLYDPKTETVYLLADSLKDAPRRVVQEIVAHEYVGHLGIFRLFGQAGTPAERAQASSKYHKVLKEVFGAEFANKLKKMDGRQAMTAALRYALDDAARKSPELKKKILKLKEQISEDYGEGFYASGAKRKLDMTLNPSGEPNNFDDFSLGVEEMFAAIAQVEDVNPSLWKRLVKAVRRVLKLQGSEVDITDTAVGRLIKASRKAASETRQTETKAKPQKARASMGQQKMAERDAEYLKAVEADDTEAMQRIIDQTAREKGFHFGRVFHGSRKKFNVFKSERDPSGLIYFSENKQFATDYPKGVGGHRTPDPEVQARIEAVDEKREEERAKWNKFIKTREKELEKSKGRALTKDEKNALVEEARKGLEDWERSQLDGLTYRQAIREMGLNVKEVYLDTRNYSEGENQIFDPVEQWREFYDVVKAALDPSSFDSDGNVVPEVQKSIEEGHYLIWEKPSVVDAVFEKYPAIRIAESSGKKAETIAVRDPERIKLADPITRDDGGEIILPSQRFDISSDDVRFARGGESIFRDDIKVPKKGFGLPGVLKQVVKKAKENPIKNGRPKPVINIEGVGGSRPLAIGLEFAALLDPDQRIDYKKAWKNGKPIPGKEKEAQKQIRELGKRVSEVLEAANELYPDFESWYQERLEMAQDIFEQLGFEAGLHGKGVDLGNPENQFILRGILAITSNGNEVTAQTEDTWHILKKWAEDGKGARFDGSKIRGTRKPEIRQKLAMFGALMDTHGVEELEEFMMRTGTAADLRKALHEELGFTKSEAAGLVKGELADEVVPFSLILGPKLGAFFHNLSGNYDLITMDLWFMRTLGKASGTQVKKHSRLEVSKKRKALKEAWAELKKNDPKWAASLLEELGLRKNASLTDENVKKIVKYFGVKDNREQIDPKTGESVKILDNTWADDLRLRVNAYYKIYSGGELVESPESGMHRRFLRKAVLSGLKQFNKKNDKNFSPAEAQAILWYYEKFIHESLGSRQKSQAPDYGTAANKLFRSVTGRDADRFRPTTVVSGRPGPESDTKLSEKVQRGKEEEDLQVRFSKRSKDYQRAVETENTGEQRRLVDEAAQDAGYSPDNKLYHGTTQDFTIFEFGHANDEGNFGGEGAIYLSSSETDARENYASESGPDMQVKIAELAVRLANEYEDNPNVISAEEARALESFDSDVDPEKFWEDKAKEQLVGDEERVIKAYVSMNNAAVIGPDDDGRHRFTEPREIYNEEDLEMLEPDAVERLKESDITPENTDPDTYAQELRQAQEELADENEYYNEDEGDVINAIRHVARFYDEVSLDNLYNWPELFDGDMRYDKLEDALNEIFAYATDYTRDGQLLRGEAVRRVFEQLGHDGVVDRRVSKKFPNMPHLDENTFHAIVFNPEQVKSADPVTFDDQGNPIPLEQRFDSKRADIRYAKNKMDEHRATKRIAEMESFSPEIRNRLKKRMYRVVSNAETRQRVEERIARDKIQKASKDFMNPMSDLLGADRTAMGLYLAEIHNLLSLQATNEKKAKYHSGEALIILNRLNEYNLLAGQQSQMNRTAGSMLANATTAQMVYIKELQAATEKQLRYRRGRIQKVTKIVKDSQKEAAEQAMSMADVRKEVTRILSKYAGEAQKYVQSSFQKNKNLAADLANRQGKFKIDPKNVRFAKEPEADYVPSTLEEKIDTAAKYGAEMFIEMHLEKKTVARKDWNARMENDFGPEIKPHLLDIWHRSTLLAQKIAQAHLAAENKRIRTEKKKLEKEVREAAEQAQAEAKAKGKTLDVDAIIKKEMERRVKEQQEREERGEVERVPVNMDQLIRQVLNESDVGSMRDFITQSLGNQQETLESMSQSLEKLFKLSTEDAQRLSVVFEQRFNELASEMREKVLKRKLAKELGETKEPKKQKAVVDRLIELVNLGALDDASATEAFAEHFGAPKEDPEVMSEIAKRVAEIQKLPDDSIQQHDAQRALMSYISQSAGISGTELFWGLWYARMLSGPNTHARNIVGTFWNTVGQIFSYSTTETASGKTGYDFQKLLYGFKGALHGLPVASRELVHGIMTGQTLLRSDLKYDLQPTLELDEFSRRFGKYGKFPKGLGYTLDRWKLVGRFLVSEDVFFYKTAQEARRYQLAYEAAKRAGTADGPAFKKEIDKLLANDMVDLYIKQAEGEGLTGRNVQRRARQLQEEATSPLILDPAGGVTPDEFAMQSTYTQPPEGYMGVVAHNIANNNRMMPAARFITPFTRVVANVHNMSVDYSPWGFIRTGDVGRAFEKLTGKEAYEFFKSMPQPGQKEPKVVKGDELHARRAKALMGSSMLLAVGLLDALFEDEEDPWFAIYASGPSDRNKQYQMREDGWIPYSFKLGNNYYGYAYTPMLIPFAIIGKMRDGFRYGDMSQAQFDVLLASFGLSAMQATLEQSFLTGMSDFFKNMTFEGSAEAGAEKMKRYMAGYGKMAAQSNLLNQINRWFDDRLYYTENVTSAALANNVFFGKYHQGKPRLNALGEEVRLSKGTPIVELFVSERGTDPVWGLLARKRVYIPKINQVSIDGEVMSNDFMYEYTKQSGQELRQWLERSGAYYENKSTEEFQEALKDRATTIRKLVKSKLLRDPRFRQ